MVAMQCNMTATGQKTTVTSFIDYCDSFEIKCNICGHHEKMSSARDSIFAFITSRCAYFYDYLLTVHGMICR